MAILTLTSEAMSRRPVADSEATTPVEETKPTVTDKNAVVKGNNTFAFELYGKLRSADGNLFLSPYSISSALAMTYAGARAETRAQMAKVLHFDGDDTHLHSTFRDLNTCLNAEGKSYEISVANALWGQQGYAFLDEFLKLTKDNYGAGLNEVDFVKATETARKTINTWVEKETRDKIKDLLKPGVLNHLTRLVLTNAIYFKGTWDSQFNKNQTRELPFHVQIDKTVQAPMMYQKEPFKFMETDKLQALELPYKGDELSMVILLPKKQDGLAELESSLCADSLSNWLKGLGNQKVKVYLPRFKTTSEFSLGDVLSSMGMIDAFSLPTAAVMALASMPAPVPIFRADHPFIFLIRDVASGSILFLGRIVNPVE
jgi:serpin B